MKLIDQIDVSRSLLKTEKGFTTMWQNKLETLKTIKHKRLDEYVQIDVHELYMLLCKKHNIEVPEKKSK